MDPATTAIVMRLAERYGFPLNLNTLNFVLAVQAELKDNASPAIPDIPAIMYNGDTKRDPALRERLNRQVSDSAAALQSVDKDIPAGAACEICHGVGRIGTPGQPCFACDGTGQSRFPQAAPMQAAASQNTLGANEREPLPAMPGTQDRRPLDDDEPDGYLESDLDWASNNEEAVRWLADNHQTIREALAASPEASEDLKRYRWAKGRAAFPQYGTNDVGKWVWWIDGRDGEFDTAEQAIDSAMQKEKK